MDVTQNPSPSTLKRRSRHVSEWLIKALEGGSGKRKSKKISDPDFVHPDAALNSEFSSDKNQTNSTVETDTESDCHSDATSLNDSQTIENTSLNDSQTIGMDFEHCSENDGSGYSTSTPSTPRGMKKRGRKPRIKDVDNVEVKKNSGSSESPMTLEGKTSVTSLLNTSVESGNKPVSRSVSRQKSNGLEKDTYCWFCHKLVNENLLDHERCEICFKIVHKKCAAQNVQEKDFLSEDKRCETCSLHKKYIDTNTRAHYVDFLGDDIYVKQLRFIIAKLKQYYPSLQECQSPVDLNEFPDYRNYIAHPVDFEMIDRRLSNGEYRCLDTFFEEFKWMFHNSSIFNGGSSVITRELKSLLKYLRMDLYDLDACANCYINAYTKPETWFIEACPKPHLLVWAQLKGFPYWPAKVYDSHLEQKEGLTLVKFFGDHARSWLPYNNIFLYSLNPPITGTRAKKAQGLTESMEEMSRHIEFLKTKFKTFSFSKDQISIGKNAKERDSQLNLLLPSYTPPLPSKQSTAKCPQVSGISKITPLKITLQKTGPIKKSMESTLKVVEKVDLNDKKSKRNLLSMLAERVQEAKSDTEESVKSLKVFEETSGRKSNSLLRSKRHQFLFKGLENNLEDAHKVSKKPEISKSKPLCKKKETDSKPLCKKRKTETKALCKKSSDQETIAKQRVEIANTRLRNSNFDRSSLRRNCVANVMKKHMGKSEQRKIMEHKLKDKKKGKCRDERRTKERIKLDLIRKQRLFKYKKYSGQLFEFRKLENKNCLSKSVFVAVDIKPKDTRRPHLSKDIQDCRVVLKSLSIQEIRDLKRKVKLIQNEISSPEKSLSDRLSETFKFKESDIVPIEETMRIHGDSTDLGMDIDADPLSSTIEQVANGSLANDISYEEATHRLNARPYRSSAWKHKAAILQNNPRQNHFKFNSKFTVVTKEIGSSVSADTGLTQKSKSLPTVVTKEIDSSVSADTRSTQKSKPLPTVVTKEIESSVSADTRSTQKSKPLPYINRKTSMFHGYSTAEEIMSFLYDTEANSPENQSLTSADKVRKLAQSFIDLKKNQTQKLEAIMLDNDYNALLQTHELLLHSNYVSEFGAPVLTEDDYDMVCDVPLEDPSYFESFGP